MPISIQVYSEDKVPAVKEFNQRLAEGGIAPEFHFPESHVPYWLPRADSQRIYQQYFLAVDEHAVRGGFILKYQEFLVRGQMQMLAYYHLPVSEGIVDKKFAGVGVHMLRSAMKMEPALFALGMGGFDRPLPMMLKAMRWEMGAVPFYYKVNHPSRFFRQIAPLRSSAVRRAAGWTFAATGTGWLGIKTLHWVRTKNIPRGTAEVINTFGPWSDELWQGCSTSYTMIGKRDSFILNILYPHHRNFLCLKVISAGHTVGWAVVLDTQMENNKYFGGLRVGSIADCLASPEDALTVVEAATRFLENRGVDLVISNHSHKAWCQAFRCVGFLEGPSNFVFAASPDLANKLRPFGENQFQVYLNRGDGDGPVNL
jgi:hypothetical protein